MSELGIDKQGDWRQRYPTASLQTLCHSCGPLGTRAKGKAKAHLERNGCFHKGPSAHQWGDQPSIICQSATGDMIGKGWNTHFQVT